MARPRKPKDFGEQLQLIDQQIAAHREEIQKLKLRRKEVAETKEKADMQQLLELVRNSGKTPAEFLDALNSDSQDEEDGEQE